MEKNTHKPNLRSVAFALAALGATIPSWAHAQATPPTEHVYFGDLDLGSEAGVKALDRRLDRAVERVCGEAAVRNLRAQRLIERCREQTHAAIQQPRELAIAKATGQETRGLADNSPRGQSRVSLAD